MTNDLIFRVENEKQMQAAMLSKLENEFAALPEGSLYMKNIRGKNYLYFYSSNDTTCNSNNGSNSSRNDGDNCKKNDKNNCSHDSGKNGSGNKSNNGLTGGGKNHEDKSIQGRTILPRQKCLSAKDRGFGEALQRKRFLKICLPQLKNNISAMDAFLKEYRDIDPSALFKNMEPAYQLLSMPAVLPGNVNAAGKDISVWLQEPFGKNESFPEGLIHRTLGGRIVRSKSEMIIAGILEANDVPFRYEAALILGNHTYYPDFTIFNPNSGRILYWEHFGMMTDEDYEFAAYKKLTNYRRNGITSVGQSDYDL